MFCKRCGNPMRRVMSFYDGKSYEFNRCPNCWYETKKIPLFFKGIEPKQKKKCYANKNINKSNGKRYKKEKQC